MTSSPSVRTARTTRTGVALCTALATGLAGLATVPHAAPAHAAVVANPVTHSAPGAAIGLEPVGSHETGVLGESAAEIVAHHPDSQRVMVVNAQSGKIDVLDVSEPAAPELLHSVDGGAGTTINSVAVRADGLAAATVEPADKTEPGSLIFFDAAGDGEELGRVGVGSLPDMVTITADGGSALVANEGEPAEDYSVDPEGSVSVVALPETLEAPAQSDVRTADFTAFEDSLPEGVRVFGPEEVDGAEYTTTVAQNLEPEYIAAVDGTAYVTLQENNAVAVVDIAAARVTDILPLGTVDHSQPGTGLDASDRDEKVNIAEWPVKGLVQPDSIGAYQAGGTTYFVTANEGDARDWDAYSEEARVKHLGDPDETDYLDRPLPGPCEGFAGLDAEGVADLQEDENLGRLNITLADGLSEDGSCYEELYSYGTRGFSVYSADGTRVFDSGAEFEEILADVAERSPLVFNSNHEETAFDDRSDNKGPEPEGLTLGEIDGRTYAFIGLERVGGIFVYDVTDPAGSKFVTYVNNRDFSVDPDATGSAEGAGDLGPEGLAFISAEDSPNGRPMLVVGNEVSGTTTLFEITGADGDDADDGDGADGSSEGDFIAGSALGSSAGTVFGVLAGVLGLLGVLGLFGQPLLNAMGDRFPQLRAQIEQALR
ncbi:choice-of-anchor I family protein [Corynebacterium frankenforstense]|uniref:choice-of-anchor I family protein n=1 Tax=Corynebacterium frankenforstense TaxID=1230998 RepID=UPI00095286EB|nr:choice-of-anchor I family protein [Corynebacterium frankenforstense]